MSDEETSSDEDWNERTSELKKTIPVKTKSSVEVVPLSQTQSGTAKKKHSK